MDSHSPSRDLALSRLCESFTSAAEALLLTCDLRPAATADLWLDPVTASSSTFAQALSVTRALAEKDPALRCFARPLDEIEETLVRAAGWTLFAKMGGVGWCAPDDEHRRQPRTRTEAAALVRQRIEGRA